MKRLFAAFLILAACGSPGAAEEPSIPAEASPAPEPDPKEVPETAPPACSPLVPRQTPLKLSVMPEASATPFVAVIDRARTSLRVMVYQMGFGPILEGLE